MKIKFIRSYRKQGTGNVVNVYAVSGTPAQLEAYKEAQGDNYVADETTGAPLWFSTRYVGETGTLLTSANGKVFADTSEFDKAASLCEQYKGTALGTEMAKIMAERLLGGKSSAAVGQSESAPADIKSL